MNFTTQILGLLVIWGLNRFCPHLNDTSTRSRPAFMERSCNWAQSVPICSLSFYLQSSIFISTVSRKGIATTSQRRPSHFAKLNLP